MSETTRPRALYLVYSIIQRSSTLYIIITLLLKTLFNRRRRGGICGSTFLVIIAKVARIVNFRLISYSAGQARVRVNGYGARPDIGRCYHIQTPTGARTVHVCDHARENRLVPGLLSISLVMYKSLKSYGINFMCDHSNKYC